VLGPKRIGFVGLVIDTLDERSQQRTAPHSTGSPAGHLGEESCANRCSRITEVKGELELAGTAKKTPPAVEARSWRAVTTHPPRGPKQHPLRSKNEHSVFRSAFISVRLNLTT